MSPAHTHMSVSVESGAPGLFGVNSIWKRKKINDRWASSSFGWYFPYLYWAVLKVNIVTFRFEPHRRTSQLSEGEIRYVRTSTKFSNRCIVTFQRKRPAKPKAHLDTWRRCVAGRGQVEALLLQSPGGKGDGHIDGKVSNSTGSTEVWQPGLWSCSLVTRG